MTDQNTFEVDFKASEYPEFTTPRDSMISVDFGSLSAQEQETQRNDWKTDLGTIHILRMHINGPFGHAPSP